MTEATLQQNTNDFRTTHDSYKNCLGLKNNAIISNYMNSAKESIKSFKVIGCLRFYLVIRFTIVTVIFCL